MIITNRGGLPETVTNAKILEKLNVKNLTKTLDKLIKDNLLRTNLQNLSNKNFYLTHKFVSSLIDNYRSEKLYLKKNIYIKSKKKNLEFYTLLILTNVSMAGFFNTGRRINNGLIRLGHSVLGFSDRDIQKYYKSFKDIKGQKILNEKLKKLVIIISLI